MTRTRSERVMTKVTVAALLVLICGTVVASSSEAGTVRGRLFRVAYGKQYPARFIAVTIVNPRSGRSQPAYTNSAGMYYLSNVPPGVELLEIWWSRDPSQPPLRYHITVNNSPYTDIAPIQIP